MSGESRAPHSTRPAPEQAEPLASTIGSLLEARARSADGDVVIVAPGRSPLTYVALLEQVESAAASLGALGLGREDRVAIVLGGGPELATAFLASASVGACAPLNPAYRAGELDFYLADLGAKALVTASGVETPAREVARARGIPIVELEVSPNAPAGAFVLPTGTASGPAVDPPGPDDVALVLHTSGTTSRPKLVPLTHRNLLASARNVAATLALDGGDRCLNVMPLFHIHGLVAGLLAPLHAGGSVACPPSFRAAPFFAWWEELAPTWYTAVPTMHQALLSRAGSAGDTIASRPLRFARSSSAALPPSVLGELEVALHAPVIEAYGMTEAAHQMASNPLPPAERKPGAVGLPAGPEIAILDGEGRSLPAGVVGEVAIRGENVFAGYEGNPEANRLAFVDGWFRTGDEGVLDDEGYLLLRGRLKEIINRAGEKISPREVDEVLLGHPAVRQAVAFSVPDRLLGEDVAAAVVLEPGLDSSQAELQRFVAGRLADFKVPRQIVFLDELPRGATGKVQRIGLAEQLGLGSPEEPRPAAPPYVAPRTDLEREVAALFAEILGVERVGATDDFFTLGGDSVAAAELVGEVCGRGHAMPDLPAASVLWAPTVERFAKLLAGEHTGGSLLVALGEQGEGTPLFLAHHHQGHALGYVPMTRGITDRPVYGLEARGLAGLEAPHERIEEMASAYVDEVRRVQPQGPYLLGGHCMGALIAFEMARQLASAGDEVGLVVMLDPTTGRCSSVERIRHRGIYFGERARIHARRGDLGPWLLRKLTGRRAPAPEPPQRRPSRPPTPARAAFLEVMAGARDRYVPGHYPGRVTVVRNPLSTVPCSYWRRLAEDVRCISVPSTGSAAEHRELLGRELRAALAEADQTSARAEAEAPRASARS
jgi:acyl-CoA synthetase (AMP-forming)/AMP-acid ligase II